MHWEIDKYTDMDLPTIKYLPLALLFTAVVLFYVGYILKNKND